MARIVTGIWLACVGGAVAMMVLLALVATGMWPGIGGGVLWPVANNKVQLNPTSHLTL